MVQSDSVDRAVVDSSMPGVRSKQLVLMVHLCGAAPGTAPHSTAASRWADGTSAHTPTDCQHPAGERGPSEERVTSRAALDTASTQVAGLSFPLLAVSASRHGGLGHTSRRLQPTLGT
jgi:hypothetical protein